MTLCDETLYSPMISCISYDMKKASRPKIGPSIFLISNSHLNLCNAYTI